MAERQILLYISALSDCDVERSILGRAMADVPVELGWRIVQSNGPNDPIDVRAIRNADLHVLILGEDIGAPIGVEWKIARRVGHRPRLYLREMRARTPAARSFIRYVEDTWTGYESPAELRRDVLLDASEYILDRAGRYALKPQRIVRLKQWRDQLSEEVDAGEGPTDASTGSSSLIFSREALATSGGVLLSDEEAEPDTDHK